MKKSFNAGAGMLVVGAVVLIGPFVGAGEATPPVNDTAVPEATAPGAGATDAVAKGRAILEANCARCHAIGMEDSSRHEEAPPFRVVVTRYPPADLAEALAEGIVSGHPDMPEFIFQPQEIEAIIAYLGTLTPAPEAAPENGSAPEKD
jgi:mono/diheme cytochrome c family protein